MSRLKLTALAALGPALLASTAWAQSPFRAERWAEDWRQDESNALKNIPLSDRLDLDLGFDARWKFESLDAPKLGFSGETEDSWMAQRLQAHASLRIGSEARLFLQVGAHDAVGRRTTSSADDDRFDLNQAFVDFNRDFGATHASLRLGRQELFLGSPRFVTLRDNGNLRQRHELARLSATRGPWRADIFSGRPMRDRPGVFDDSADQSQEFMGARLGLSLGDSSIDALYYDLSRDDFAMAGLVADERRRSIGARLASHFEGFELDSEFLIQSGRFGDQKVNAYGGAVELARRFADAPWSPRLGVRATYGSGDSDAADARQQTFAPPFPRSSWFGQNGLASFSNTAEAAATLGLAPNEAISLDFKASALWRAEAGDFVYAGANTALPGTRGGDSFVGFTPSVALVWRATDNAAITLYASSVDVSDNMAARGARDIAYAQAALAIRY